MQSRKIILFLTIFCAALALIGGACLATVLPASAQCGSQASSCKNCHEVQGQDPVNADGTDWHMPHAFGDFCYLCHAGNNQALDATLAHSGMVAPLSDIKAACLQCHPNDYEALAQGYATTLGVEIGASAATPASSSAGAAASPAAAASAVGSITPTLGQPAAGASTAAFSTTGELMLDDPNLVDFSRRYDEIVLGKKPVNRGNAILLGLIGLVLIGGGGFVIKNEKWLDFSALDAQKMQGEYPADVVEMLPDLQILEKQDRQKLARLVKNPSQMAKTLKLAELIADEFKEGETKQ